MAPEISIKPDLKALAPNRVNLLIFALRGLQDFIVA